MWLCAHLASLFVPLAMTMSIVNLIYTVFVPILTANGGTPDMAFGAEMSIAILTTAATMMYTSYLCSVVAVLTKRPYISVIVLFIVTCIFVTLPFVL